MIECLELTDTGSSHGKGWVVDHWGGRSTGSGGIKAAATAGKTTAN